MIASAGKVTGVIQVVKDGILPAREIEALREEIRRIRLKMKHDHRSGGKRKERAAKDLMEKAYPIVRNHFRKWIYENGSKYISLTRTHTGQFLRKIEDIIGVFEEPIATLPYTAVDRRKTEMLPGLLAAYVSYDGI